MTASANAFLNASSGPDVMLIVKSLG